MLSTRPAGRSPYRRNGLQARPAQGIAQRVHFAGYRADPASCFYLMDIFALPSAFEGFGIVFVEAAASGLPCIGTAVGGIVDAIDDEVTGVLVPPQTRRPSPPSGGSRRILTTADGKGACVAGRTALFGAWLRPSIRRGVPASSRAARVPARCILRRVRVKD